MNTISQQLPQHPRRIAPRFSRLATALTLCAILAASWIVAVPASGGEARHPDAVSVFHCTFGQDWDVNYDRWPDRWIRATGLEYPHYVDIEIHDDETAPNGNCLQINLDGASASVSSPPIRIIPRFSYVFEAQLKNEALAHSTVLLTLNFCDKAGHVLQTKKSKPFSNTKGWVPVDLGTIELSDPTIDRVVLNLDVVRGDKGDLKGRVSLADVWLARKPRIAVSTNSACNVYSELDKVVVKCELSGIRERDPELRFQLLDSAGNPLQDGTSHLNGRLIIEDGARTSDVADGIGQTPAGYEGTTEWRPKISEFGFYRVVVKMLSSEHADGQATGERELDSRTIWLAVVPPLPMPKQGEFGWTLPGGDQPLSFQELSQLLPQVGVNWVKLPVWFSPDDPHRGDELIRFVELLGASNIEVVGMIDRPPPDTDLVNRSGHNATIADVLALDSSLWSPLLEPVMTRLSLRVRWWQLGRDYDTSFVGFPNLNKRVDELRTALFRFGQDVRLGLCWDGTSASQNVAQATWDFQQYCLETPTPDDKFNELLARKPENSARRWVLVEPPALGTDPAQSSEPALAARSSEFVRRLVAAKESGADAIIVPNPFNDDNGLMRASGMPAKLLLPWRTTAAMLGGAKFLGHFQLPSGSENRVFLRPDHQVVMVVWNNVPTQEVLYLGDNVRIVDISGRTSSAALEGREQSITVGPVPTFVLGLHEAITRWRMASDFECLQVPSEFDRSHPNSVHFQNFFPQGVGGSLKIVVPQDDLHDEAIKGDDHPPEATTFVPDRWTIEPPHGTFQLAAGEKGKFPFEIKLKDALFGKQPVRIEFTVEADERYQFCVYREMEVGTSDVTLNVQTHLDKDGTMIVEQTMTNGANRLSDFKCCLYVKGQRRQRTQVYRLSSNPDRKVYRYQGGRELVGNEMLLEIEEINGPRVLKYRFLATAEAPPEPSDKDSKDKPEQKKPVVSPQAEVTSVLAPSHVVILCD